MSEYWKSTPKYWCKHCKTYVTDTKLQKQQHEASAKHQVAIKRFIRDLNRSVEKDERDTQRAKNEVSRLQRVVGEGFSSSSGPFMSRAKPTGTGKVSQPAASLPQMTEEMRLKNIEDLQALGVAVPTSVQNSLALVGEWQTVAVHDIMEPGREDRTPTRAEAAQEDGDSDVDNASFRGKRKARSNEKSTDSGFGVALDRGFRVRTKEYPVDSSRPESLVPVKIEFKKRVKMTEQAAEITIEPKDDVKLESPSVDRVTAAGQQIDSPNEIEEEGPELASVLDIAFKKRKAKNVKQK